jgi:competence protein ComEC
MSHPELDHYGGLAFLAKHFAVKEFWFNGEEADSQRFQQLKHTLAQAGVNVRTLCRDASPTDQSGVYIAILHPPCPAVDAVDLDTNNASLVLRLSHGEIDFLFSGDIEAAGERVLLTSLQSIMSEILKVPHHGSRTSSTPKFVTAVSAEVAVASMGFHNRFGFPAPEVVQRHTAQGGEFLRTDQAGAVTVISDGRGYTLRKTLPPSGSAQ